MITGTNLNSTIHSVDTVDNTKKARIPLLSKYKAYINSEEQEQVFWFLKAIIIIPCVIMVPSVMVMHHVIGNHVPFVGLCMVLFFVNIVVHIAEVKSKYYIPVYHFSILAMILIPFVTFIFNS